MAWSRATTLAMYLMGAAPTDVRCCSCAMTLCRHGSSSARDTRTARARALVAGKRTADRAGRREAASIRMTPSHRRLNSDPRGTGMYALRTAKPILTPIHGSACVWRTRSLPRVSCFSCSCWESPATPRMRPTWRRACKLTGKRATRKPGPTWRRHAAGRRGARGVDRIALLATRVAQRPRRAAPRFPFKALTLPSRASG